VTTMANIYTGLAVVIARNLNREGRLAGGARRPGARMRHLNGGRGGTLWTPPGGRPAAANQRSELQAVPHGRCTKFLRLWKTIGREHDDLSNAIPRSQGAALDESVGRDARGGGIQSGRDRAALRAEKTRGRDRSLRGQPGQIRHRAVFERARG